VELTSSEFEGQIGKGVQARVHRLMDQGHSDHLDRAARTSLSIDGPFSANDIRDVNQVDAGAANRALDVLMRENLVAVVEEDDTGKRYEFLEEGLPMYLWITSTLQSVRPKENTRVALP
jgi:hypothetical protein